MKLAIVRDLEALFLPEPNTRPAVLVLARGQEDHALFFERALHAFECVRKNLATARFKPANSCFANA